MTRDDIIRMARKAGAFPELSATPEKDIAFLQRFAALAIEAKLREKNAKPAEQQEPVAFEDWGASYSTLSIERDAQGHYASIEVEMMWHAWQAAKKNAPEGASWGESAANGRPGLAKTNSTCNHEFVLDFKSSIRLCKHCGRMERKATPPANAKQEQRIAELEKDAARYRYLKDYHSYHYFMQLDSPAEHGIEYQWQQGTYEERNQGLDGSIDAAIDAAMKEKT